MSDSSNDPGYDGEVTPARTKIASHRPPPAAPEWALHAWAEYKAGSQNLDAAARVQRYTQATTNPAASTDETPWASAFACWCMEHSGVRSTRSAVARSWMSWGIPLPFVDPPYGAVAVLWRGSPVADSGHVGFFVGYEKSEVWLLGGNQHHTVSLAKYPRTRLLGYRWPLTENTSPVER